MANQDNERAAPLLAMQSPLAVIVVALLALFGIRAPQMTGDKAKGQPAVKSDADAAIDEKQLRNPANLDESPPWKLLREYFHLDESQDYKRQTKEIDEAAKQHVGHGKTPNDDKPLPGDPIPSDPIPSDPIPSDPIPDDPVLHAKHQVVKAALADRGNRFVPRVDCLIATVADPIDSRFQHIFDESIDAIQRGVGKHGYDLDRFLFLWTDDLKDLAKAKSPVSKPHRSRKHPSAMLFRRNLYSLDGDPADTWHLKGNTNSLLMVLLVGETPTAGVHKQALAEALEFAAFCHANLGERADHPLNSQGDRQTRPDDHHLDEGKKVERHHNHSKHRPGDSQHVMNSHLKVLGPEFSGSAPSLRQGIVDWWRRELKTGDPSHHSPRFEVEIISGAATSDSNHTLLNYVESNEKPFSRLAMHFNATVLPDSTTRLELLRHLIKTRGIPPEKIAFLSERGTAYGRSVGAAYGRSGRDNSSNNQETDAAAKINNKREEMTDDQFNELLAKISNDIDAFGKKDRTKEWQKLHNAISIPLSVDEEKNKKYFEKARSAEILFRGIALGHGKKWNTSASEACRLANQAWVHRLWFLAGRRAQFGQFLEDSGLEFGSLARMREISYPLGLSRIRSEFEKSAAFQNENDKNGPRLTRRNVELRLGNIQHAIDTLPIFADVTTPAIDITLEQLLSLVKRDDIRAVGLAGTDVLDKLFLAQQLRAHAPDILLFTQEYDVRYLHADYATYLNGMMIASSYPFSPRSRGWTANDARDRDLTFGTDTAHGVYNATVALLNLQFRDQCNFEPVALLDYGPPFDGKAALEGEDHRLGPSVRISMVSETGLWPVDVVPIHDGKHVGAEAYVHRPGDIKVKHRREQTAAVREQVRFVVRAPPLFPVIVALLVGTVTVALIAAVNWLSDWPHQRGFWRMVLRFVPWCGLGDWHWNAGGRGPRRITRLELQRGKRRWSPRSLRALWLTGLLVCVAVASIVIASPHLVAVRFLGGSQGTGLVVENVSTWTLWGVLIVVLFLVTATVFALLRVLVYAPEFTTWVGASVAIAAVGCFGAAVIFCAPDAIRAAVFFERVGALSSGVSPLMPVLALLAAFGCWCVCHLRREYFLRVFRLSNPFPSDSHGRDSHGRDANGRDAMEAASESIDRSWGVNLAGFGHRFTELNAWLKGKPKLPRAAGDWVAGGVFSIWLIYILAVRWTGTAEGAAFDFVFRALLVGVLIAYFALLMRVRAVAGLFERLLRRLGQHPMVFAFGYVPERLAAKVSGQLFAAAPHPGDLEFSTRCLKRLVRKGVDDSLFLPFADGEVDANRMERRLVEVFGRDRAHQIEALLLANRLTMDLAQVSREHLVRKLDGYWSRIEVQRERTSGSDGEKKAGEDPEGGWAREAEVFVAMQWMNLIRQVFTHLQNLMMFLIAMLLCILIGLQVYPFQPRNGLLTFWFGLMAWTVLSIVIVLVKFNRDEVLSRIGQTVPNQFTFDRALVVPLLTYVVAPIAGLFMVWFPALGRVLFGWLGAIGAWPGA